LVSLKLVTTKQKRKMKVESRPPICGHKLKVILSQEGIQTSRQVFLMFVRDFKTKCKVGYILAHFWQRIVKVDLTLRVLASLQTAERIFLMYREQRKRIDGRVPFQHRCIALKK